jgi:hypothetical protein
MNCTLLFKDRFPHVKTPAWVAVDDRGSTRIYFLLRDVTIPIPFAVFDRYTDHCAKIGITANLLPDNLPNIMSEFGRPSQGAIVKGSDPAPKPE